MRNLVYDGLIGVAAVLIGLGVFLISLDVLDILARLTVVLLTRVSATFERAARVRSALTTGQEHQRR